MKFSRATKILHLLIMLIVIAQLTSQSLMFVPSPDKLPESEMEAWMFVIHLSMGIMGLCFILVFLMSVMDDEERSKRLFPWLHKAELQPLLSELKSIPQWFSKGVPAPDSGSRIASMVHGLGALLIFALGSTGIMFYMGLEPDGAMDAISKFFRESHEFFALILWFYLVGHVGMYIRHLSKRNIKVKEIFTFDDKQ